MTTEGPSFIEDLKTARLLCMVHLNEVERTVEKFEAYYNIPDSVMTSIHQAVSALHIARTRLSILIKNYEENTR